MIPTIGRAPVEAFYTTGYNDIVDDTLVVSLHDGFVGSGSWNEFLPGQANILMDTHHYEVFDQGQLGMSPDAHVGSACAFGASIATNTKSTISGEWTSSITGMSHRCNSSDYDNTDLLQIVQSGSMDLVLVLATMAHSTTMALAQATLAAVLARMSAAWMPCPKTTRPL